MLSETFWVAFVATASGMVIKLATLCFKSKCKEFIICGGRIKCIRDVLTEEKEAEFEMTHTPSSPKNENL